MGNGDNTKGSYYFELLLVAVAGSFGGIVKAVTNNGNGVSPSSHWGEIIQTVAVGTGAAVILVAVLPLFPSVLYNLIKRDRRLLIALALIGGYIGEPIWTAGGQMVKQVVESAIGQGDESLPPGSTDEESDHPQPDLEEKEPPIHESESSENNPEQKLEQDPTARNIASQSPSEPESSENGDEERTQPEVGDPASGNITGPPISRSNGGGETQRMPTAEDVPGYSSGLKIVQRTFCLEMDRPQCKIPAVSENISLSKIKTIENNVPRLYFWTSVKVTEDLNIMHVWSSSNRSDEWAEPIHVSTGTQFPYLTRERFLSKVEEYLTNNTNTNLHSNQAVLLDLQRSDRFRTYSSIKAVPGRYTVEVRYLGSEKIVPGGEAKTIIIDPSH